ncbi:MAG TPA: PPC domain-containing DNA-binding protein [Candidatus Limnocylindrales bacterium]|nr:PPC domain-containing DNA-binding protein [Candidatus Limnocylindrales bacterium]
MSQAFEAAAARPGRLIVGRLHPGADLIEGLEAACDAHGVRFAAVVSCYGSLTRAGFKFLQLPDGETRPRLVAHRVDERVEFMGGQGLVCETPEGGRETHLHGSISDATGAVSGGHFVPAENEVYNNMDFVLQELIGVRLVRAHDPVTDTVEMRVEADDGASDASAADERAA